jgi:phage tail-like protein
MASSDLLMTTNTFALEVGGVVVSTFRKCTGLSYETEVVESKEVTTEGLLLIRKMCGAVKWGPIELERQFDGSKDLEQWRSLVLDGKIDEARRDCSIIQFDSTLTEVCRWNLRRAWCSKYSVSDLDASSNAIAIEKATITHEGLQRDAA